MKTTTLTAAAVSLLQVVAAQPHRNRLHQHQHEKKDVLVTVEEIIYGGPEVVVYVDQFGTPRSTTTVYGDYTTIGVSYSTSSGTSSTASTSTLSYSSTVPTSSIPSTLSTVASSTSIYVAPAPTTSIVPVVTPSAPAATSSAPVASTAPVAETGGLGFSYNGYKADSTCKSADDVLNDFAALPGGYSLVRIYGTDCNQVSNVLAAAEKYGLKLFAGVFSLANVANELQIIIEAANAAGGWSLFDTINIGNELVDTGAASAAEVVAALNSAKTTLAAAGYTGNVVTVDTLAATRNNPSLCDSSSYCAVNCHPFFDENTSASEAGTFINSQVELLRATLANSSQEIFITETGWPWQGTAHGEASVSLADQATAIAAIKDSVTLRKILLSAYNDLWKTLSASTFDAERSWGIGGVTAPSDE